MTRPPGEATGAGSTGSVQSGLTRAVKPGLTTPPAAGAGGNGGAAAAAAAAAAGPGPVLKGKKAMGKVMTATVFTIETGIDCINLYQVRV